MNIEETSLEGAFIIKPEVFGDNRGWFMESYSRKKLYDLGIDIDFVQDNRSYSAYKGVIRGLHCQINPMAQAKLVTCTKGAIKDVIVDIRDGSPTFMQWTCAELSEDNHKMLLVPKGFLHGFVTLTDQVEINYKVDAYYSCECDRSIRYDDELFDVDWGVTNPILSEKDRKAPLYKDSDVYFTYDYAVVK